MNQVLHRLCAAFFRRVVKCAPSMLRKNERHKVGKLKYHAINNLAHLSKPVSVHPVLEEGRNGRDISMACGTVQGGSIKLGKVEEVTSRSHAYGSD